MLKGNVEIHSLVVDILQSLASRGDLDQTSAETVESVVTLKLFALVHSGRLELQNRLLHLLHSIISLLHASSDKHRADSGSAMPNAVEAATLDKSMAAHSYRPPQSPESALFVQLLIDGISTSTNRPLLHHWLDFVLMTIPQFPHILSSAIFSLNSCICREIKGSLENLSTVFNAKQGSVEGVGSCNDDAEFIMLLNALEQLVLFSLDEADLTSTDEIGPIEKPASEGSGLLSIMSNVFLADSSGSTQESTLTVSLIAILNHALN